MCHFMEVSSMNAHEIGHFECGANSPWYEGRPKDIGASLEPTLVLFNHSCDPNIIKVNLGNVTVAIASRKIREGEEVNFPTKLIQKITIHNK